MIKRPLLAFLLAVILGILANTAFFYICLISYLIFLLVLFTKKPGLFFGKIEPKLHRRYMVIMAVIAFVFVLSHADKMLYEKNIEEKRAVHKTLYDTGAKKISVSGCIRDISVYKDEYAVKLENCMIKGQKSPAGNMILYTGNLLADGKTLKPGQKISAYGTYKAFEPAKNPGGFDAEKYYEQRGYFGALYVKNAEILSDKYNPVLYLVSEIRMRVSSVLRKVFDEETAGIINAMLTGNKSLLDPDVKKMYKRAGISHVLAVSGLHVSVVCLGLYSLFGQLGMGFKARYVSTLIILFIFTVFTGMGVATIRAAFMCFIMLSGRMLKRSYDMISSLSFTAIVLLLINPGNLTDAAFLMSFVSITGVALAAELRLQSLTGLVITMVMLPLTLYFYYEFSPYSILLNILILPCLTVLLSFGILTSLLGFVSVSVAMFSAGAVYYILKAFLFLSEVFSKLPFSYVCTGKPAVYKICIYYAAAAFLYCFLKSRKKMNVKTVLATGIISLSSVIFLTVGNRADGIFFLSVGQGDCSVYMAKNTVLFDCGSSDNSKVGEYVLSPALKCSGRILFTATVSHTDKDHISGILEVLQSMREYKGKRDFIMHYDGNIGIERLVLPKVSEKNEKYVMLEELAGKKGVEVVYFERGDEIRFKDVVLKCLSPEGAKSSENETSLVFLLEDKKYRVFYMGDADSEAEKNILDRGFVPERNGKFTVLKVGHHGSRTATALEFVKAVRPDTAVISCGKNNSYGHPHDETIRTLNALKVKILRTDEWGAAVFK